jgi:hypothetical protein
MVVTFKFNVFMWLVPSKLTGYGEVAEADAFE